MRLLMIHPERDEKYGAVHSMLEMLTYLNKNHNVEPIVLVSKEGFASNYCKKMNWEYYVTGHANFMIGASTKRKEIIRNLIVPLLYLRYKIKNFIALCKVKKIIIFENIDIIHTNTSVCDFGAILAKKYNKPHFWHLREVGNIGYNRISLRRNYIEFMNNHCSNFIAISNAVKEEWVKLGLNKNIISVIYNGTEKNQLLNKSINDKIKMVITGSLSDQKGQYLLIDALSKINKDLLNNIQLDIIGEGPSNYTNYLKNKVNAYKLNNIIKFLGYKSNIYELLNNYDVGFVCSKVEGFGRVAVEYMFSKICTISSNTGALKEIFKDNYTGILFNYPDIDDLKNRIEYVINNKEIIKEIAINAYEYANSHFTAEINAKNIYSNYLKIVGDYHE